MLLNLFYPIGSIYTYLPNPDSEGNYPSVSECPIAATLGGTWTQIKGRFLVAAGQEQDKDNNSGLNLSAGDTTEFENATKGLLASPDTLDICDENGKVVWSQ